jgi:hypothetical protein
LGLQVTDISSLISHPEQWLSRFAEAEARYPEARAACDFFRNEYLAMRPVDRAWLTNAFRDKIVQFTHDPLLSRQFGAKVPGIDWEEADAEGLTILLDFSRETNTELRRFKMLWLFDYFFSWLKTRGRRSYPMALMIDEFASMTQKVFSGENPFAVEMAEFIQEYLRNSNIWLTVAHQSIEQLDEQLRNTVFSLGTYLFGRAPVPEARILADVLFKRDPMRVKHYRKVWGKIDPPPYSSRYSYSHYDSDLWLRMPQYPYFVLDTEPEYMSLEDQQEEAANLIAELGPFRFLCRPALREGEVSQSVIPVTIAHVDRDEWTGDYHFPNPQRIQDVCSLLAAQSGIPASAIRKELAVALPPERRDRVRTSSGQSRQQPRQGGQEKAQHNGNEPLPDEATPVQATTASQPSRRRREQVT